MKINSPDEIQIIDSLDPYEQIAVDDIIIALESERAKLTHGETFTGKPGTQVYTSENFVIKLHTELKFNARDTERWIDQKIASERTYEVYPPSKTWFVVHKGATPIIGNITPVLIPLHQLVKTHDSSVIVKQVSAMYEMFFTIAAQYDKLLDNGLSNFAVDNTQHLYYLDDDIYEWDKHTAFCNHIGVLIRQLDMLELNDWKQIGDSCKHSILENFYDSHELVIAYEQLKGVFVAEGKQSDSLKSFIDAFYIPRHKERGSQLDSLIAKAHDELNTGSSSQTPSNEDISADSAKSIESQIPASSSKIAILADVHANLPALEAVLNRLDEMEITQAILLGDLVGYGPHPEECINLLKDRNFFIVKGNHDHGVASGIFKKGFSMNGRFVAEWTKDKISEENRQWLEDLPPYIQNDNWLALHGSPMDKTFFNGYVYQMTYSDNLDNMESRNIKLCFHGHTHIQGIYYRAGKQDSFNQENSQNILEYDYTLVCPGSIGQPRGQIPGAEFAVYDSDTGEIDFYRIDYDLEITMNDMKKYNFPAQLIERLPLGK